MARERYDIPVEPKAGKVGTLAVFFFGVGAIVMCYVAAYMWTDADVRVAAAIGVASVSIPMTVGFFMSELRHQRSGAFWFVIAAAIMIGGLGSWAVAERDAFDDRMNLIAPGTQVPSVEVPDASDTVGP